MMLLAPLVGALINRVGAKALVVAGLMLQTTGLLWLALTVNAGTPYVDMVSPFIVAGIGMTLFFVPLASLVLGSVPTALEGVASGTNSAFRELGGVLGIAVLGAVFSSSGGYHSGQAFVNGLTPALEVGAAAVFLGMLTALAIPVARRVRAGRAAGAVTGVEGVEDGSAGELGGVPLEERYLDRWPVAVLPSEPMSA